MSIILHKNNCLFVKYPHIAKEWHPTKNCKSLFDVAFGSDKKYWWQCEKGHEWQATCNSRTGNNTGCPYCSNQKVCQENFLAVKFPEIAKQWHPSKNGKLTSADIVFGSGKKYWWQCEKEHEWEAVCRNRTTGKRGCPYCSNKKVCLDNCLFTTNFSIAKEWHPNKNGTFTSKDVTASSNKKVWWQCKKGHEWQATCDARKNKKSKCPYCANQKACLDNCLETLYPEIAQEWHLSKNGSVTSKDVVPKSGKKYWWQCEKGHEWQTAIKNRTRKQGSNCPVCNASKGEKRITEYLIKNNKIYKSQFVVKNIGIFDFEVKDKKYFLIEYHGEQHYMPVAFGSTKKDARCKNLSKIIKRDFKKERWCQCQNILLLIIPYWDFDRIEEILDNYFVDFNCVISNCPDIVNKYKNIINKYKNKL